MSKNDYIAARAVIWEQADAKVEQANQIRDISKRNASLLRINRFIERAMAQVDERFYGLDATFSQAL